jgi:pyruvate,water dikinase
LVSSETPASAFPVTWESPEHAEMTWVRDEMHFPAPLTPMTAAVLRHTFEPGLAAACAEMTWPIKGFRQRTINGWLYTATLPAAPPEAMPAHMERHFATVGSHMDELRRRWDDEYLPDVLRLTAEIEGLDFADAGPDARASLNALKERLTALWRLHFLTVFPKMAAGERFAGMYADATGSTEEMAPYKCLQGEPNKSLETDRALYDLAADARRTPAVAETLARGEPAAALAALESSPEGRAWLERFRTFLEEYGDRAQAIEVAEPTWREDPRFAVENLRRYLAEEALDPEGLRAVHLAERDRLAAAAREQLPEEARPAFDHALAVARAVWPLEEDHAFYIDQRALAGAARRALLRLGTAFAGRGQLDVPDDVWWFGFDELSHALAEGADLRDAAREARRRHRDAQLLDPPPILGRPPDPDVPSDPGLSKFFGRPGPPEVEGAALRGSAGSPGRAEGVARVVRSLDELTRVQAGDVLVCRSTTPPWTPIFASIAALVTDTGGVLAHGAIVAREYGIPAVVGTKIGTRMIPDGARVVVDGDAGEVRLVG